MEYINSSVDAVLTFKTYRGDQLGLPSAKVKIKIIDYTSSFPTLLRFELRIFI